MAKSITQYVCQQCGRVSASYMGKCPQCSAFNSMVEEVIQLETNSEARKSRGGRIHKSVPSRIDQVSIKDETRYDVSMEEFSRVLGGGIVPGSVVLISGDPGIGKSTLLLQLTLDISTRQRTLYITGEESEKQIKLRADRLLGENHKSDHDLYIMNETSLSRVIQSVNDLRPAILIIDSIQTISDDEIESPAGSISQVRESSSKLREFAKSENIAIFLIGHVTKEGMIAGPKVLEHIVDTVLYLEGDRYQSYRILRSVKNRYGATSEVGVFEMRGNGLIEVRNPSEAFLSERMLNAPGSAITVTLEGTRPLLVEIQGLTSPAQFGNARRTTNGAEYNRVLMLAAVITRRLGLKLAEQDIFINIVGGLRISEPAIDLAIAMAVVSTYRDIPLDPTTVFIGEIGLAGELRLPSQLPTRVKEAQKLGFKRAVIPFRRNKGEPLPDKIEILEARSLYEAVQLALPKKEKS